MPYQCSIRMCPGNQRHTKCVLFSFPRDETVRRVWELNTNRGEDWRATPHSRLCELHFDTSQFEREREDGKKRLKWRAIPTIFPASNRSTVFPLSSKRVASSERETKKVQHDHSYSLQKRCDELEQELMIVKELYERMESERTSLLKQLCEMVKATEETGVQACVQMKSKEAQVKMKTADAYTQIFILHNDVGTQTEDMCWNHAHPLEPEKSPLLKCLSKDSCNQIKEEVISWSPDGTSQECSMSEESTVLNDANPLEEPKYVVFESKLLELLKACPNCQHSTVLESTLKGTCLLVKQMCPVCLHKSNWTSQPNVGNIPAGNILLASSLIFSDSNIVKFESLCRLLKLKIFSSKVFFDYRRKILSPSGSGTWKEQQQQMINQIRREGEKFGTSRCWKV